jgi:arylsulfatase
MLRNPKAQMAFGLPVSVRADPFVAQHIATYKDFPPRQKPGTFNLDRVLEKLLEASGENK